MIRDFLVPNSPSTAYGGPPPLTQGRLSRVESKSCTIIHFYTKEQEAII